jgi:hypothetical protein
MDRVNDISSEIGGKMVILVEHQSTLNPNMAIRLFIYISRIYEKIIGDRNIYSGKKLKIPRPEFFVLYNGKEDFPDVEIIKLSDSFEETISLGLAETSPSLDIMIKVVNIKEGHNREIVQKCTTLAQYSAFVAKVREYEKAGLKRDGALKETIKYCRNHNILKEFLETHSSEVFNMIMTEWDWDLAKEVWQEESRAEGVTEGEMNIINLLKSGKSPEEIIKNYEVNLPPMPLYPK